MHHPHLRRPACCPPWSQPWSSTPRCPSPSPPSPSPCSSSSAPTHPTAAGWMHGECTWGSGFRCSLLLTADPRGISCPQMPPQSAAAAHAVLPLYITPPHPPIPPPSSSSDRGLPRFPHPTPPTPSCCSKAWGSLVNRSRDLNRLGLAWIPADRQELQVGSACQHCTVICSLAFSPGGWYESRTTGGSPPAEGGWWADACCFVLEGRGRLVAGG